MIKIVADIPWTGDSLQAETGNNGWLGGSEQDVNSLRVRLSKRVGYEIPILGSIRIGLDEISEKDFYLIYNFFLLREEVKTRLIYFGNYVIIEHDFKFCPNRIPGNFPGMKVPEDKILSKDFYSGARTVFCLSENQAKIFKLNMPWLNIQVLATSFWDDKELDLLYTLSERPDKSHSFGIYFSPIESKGTKESMKWCIDNKISDYMIIRPSAKKVFLETLSKATCLVFLPKITESYSRMAAEAKMLGLDVVYNSNVSFMEEPWLGELKGKELIAHFKEVLIPGAIEKIYNSLVV